MITRRCSVTREMKDLRKGLQLSSPAKFVPWGLRNLELEDLFDGFPLKKVKRGYYVLGCEPLPGLNCMLGFHLHEYDVLTEFEFYMVLKSEEQIKDSYATFQHHFETAFGSPTKTNKGTEGFEDHEWLVPGARIIHLVRERFGPEQLARITRWTTPN